jgi:3-hydroxyacyl-CoA dehydrogenase/enoyl-CoA hydratase/3-hydroxybutyryl-CoA epimerase
MPAALAWIDSVQGNPQACQHSPGTEKGYRMPGGTPSSPPDRQGWWWRRPCCKKTTRGLYPAPEAALCAMVEGAQVDYDTAMRIESRYLAGLMVNPVAKNMINTFFFNLNAIKSGQSRGRKACALQAEEGRCAGRRHDGRGHRLCAAPAAASPSVLKDVSLEKAEHGKAVQRKLTRRAWTRAAWARTTRPRCWAASRPPPCRRPAGLRPDHRGGVRKPRAQGAR